MIAYTVWVIVERHNDKTDEYEDLDLPFGGAAEFKSQQKAEDFATKLHEIAQIIHPTP